MALLADKLEGRLITSHSYDGAPEIFEASLTQMQSNKALWEHLRPKAIDPARGEVRISTDRETGTVVGATSHANVAPGIIERTVVINPTFRGSPQSLEVSVVELTAAFQAGISEVRYKVPKSHAATLRRGGKLGWQQVGKMHDLLLFSLHAEDFFTAIARLPSGMRAEPPEGR